MMFSRKLLFACVALHFIGIPLFAQAQVESAQADLYFAQFANGGPASGEWQTVFTFSNPNASAASCTLYLLGDGGQPLLINFGSGLVSQISFSENPYLTKTFQSVRTSSTITTGWGITVCSISTVQGVVTYRFLQNGVEISEISVPGTVPTQNYFSAANASLGIAMCNVYSSGTVSVVVTA